ncbi:MAG: SDR family oxidoreductase [Nitratireductor sp.]|nr:SDR family oxidoreductase [Nitratireductor sp.]
MTTPFELDFSGKQVLVIGGSSGIGNGIARAFATGGANVHVTGTRASRDDYSAEDGSDLSGLTYSQVDLSDHAAIDRYQPPFDKLDVLVLSQGTVVYKRGEFEQDGWMKVIDLNLNSLMACARRFKGMLSAANGSLIIVSSVSAFQSNIGNPAYSASKAGAVALTRTLGKAWVGEGIRVNGIAPGLIDTKLTRVTTGNETRLKAAVASIPAARLGTPADIAGAALFLVSPLANYIVGQTIIVDGGMTLS